MLDSIIREAQSLVNEKIISIFKTEGPKMAFSKLYILLPSAVRLFVKEETFVDFCLSHQSTIFGKTEDTKLASKKTTKKTALVKSSTKKVAKKSVKKVKGKK